MPVLGNLENDGAVEPVGVGTGDGCADCDVPIEREWCMEGG